MQPKPNKNLNFQYLLHFTSFKKNKQTKKLKTKKERNKQTTPGLVPGETECLNSLQKNALSSGNNFVDTNYINKVNKFNFYSHICTH